MTQKVDNCTTLSDRWTIIGNRVYELDALLSHSNTLGASQLATALLYEWEEVETCLQQYESLVDELVSTFIQFYKSVSELLIRNTRSIPGC
jgi:hypothetical protein